MNKEQIVKDLHESLGDSFESIEKIKGEQFADAVKFMHLSMHTFRLCNRLLDSDIPEKVGKTFSLQYAAMAEFGFDRICRGLSPEDKEEAWNWAKQMDSRIEQAIKELNK